MFIKNSSISTVREFTFFFKVPERVTNKIFVAIQNLFLSLTIVLPHIVGCVGFSSFRSLNLPLRSYHAYTQRTLLRSNGVNSQTFKLCSAPVIALQHPRVNAFRDCRVHTRYSCKVLLISARDRRLKHLHVMGFHDLELGNEKGDGLLDF